MEPPASTSDAKRCPDCNALVSPEAEWCGQCFRPLTELEPEPVLEGDVGGPRGVERDLPDAPPMPVLAAIEDADATVAAPAQMPEAPTKAPTWPCPACGNDNPIELDTCTVCGTSFAALMRRDEAVPQVDPKDAFKASLAYPGRGHRAIGRGLDGLARGVLFTMLAILTIIVLASGLRSTAQVVVFTLFLILTLVVYFASAFEASRMARGGSPFVTARTLLWITVGIVMASVVLLAVTVASVAS